MKQDQEKIKRRIAALLQMTKERGCTEAEAMVAASKAAVLMREYGLSDADIEMSEADIEVKTGFGSARAPLWAIIERCTNTSLLWTKGKVNKLVFYGYSPGPQIATYLMQVCDRAMNHEIAKFKRSTFYRQRRTLATKRQAVGDFTSGLICRLDVKLRAFFVDSIDLAASDAAHEYLKRMHSEAREVGVRSRRVGFDAAMDHGWMAGGRVQLAHGMSGEAAVLRIGKQEAVTAQAVTGKERIM